jgi:DNA replication protein DnaD
VRALAQQGWIKVHRTIYDDELWQIEKEFDFRSAWIDLLLMANHEDRDIIIGSQAFTVKRGQRFTSIRKLAVRWKWSEKKVTRFLDLLISTGKIYKDATHNGTLLTIVKYGVYQGDGNTNDHTNDHTSDHRYDHTNDHTSDRQTRMNKNDIRMNKNEKEIIPAPPREGGEWQ